MNNIAEPPVDHRLVRSTSWCIVNFIRAEHFTLPRQWPASYHFRLAGLTVSLRSTLRIVADEFARLHSHMSITTPTRCDLTLSLFARRAASRRRLRYMLCEEEELIYSTHDRRELVPELEMAMACGLADHLSDCVQIHAAAVAWHDVGLMLVGPPGAGKTTLVCALLARGFFYLADELVFLEPSTLRLLPYHRALCVKPAGRRVLRPFLPALPQRGYRIKDLKGPVWDCNPQTVAQHRLGTSTTIQAIILPNYDSRHRGPHLQTIARAAAVRLLSSQLVHTPQPLTSSFETLIRLVEQSACYRLQIGDLQATVAVLTEVAHRLTIEARMAGSAS